MATNVTASTAQIFDGIIQYPGTNTFKMSPVSIATDTTLTIAQSGQMIKVSQTAGVPYQITLPVVATANGIYYRFQIVAAANADVTIRAVANGVMKGVCISPTANITSGGTNVFTFAGGTVVVGDFAFLYCDGVSWSVTACSRINAGVTLT